MQTNSKRMSASRRLDDHIDRASVFSEQCVSGDDDDELRAELVVKDPFSSQCKPLAQAVLVSQKLALDYVESIVDQRPFDDALDGEGIFMNLLPEVLKVIDACEPPKGPVCWATCQVERSLDVHAAAQAGRSTDIRS